MDMDTESECYTPPSSPILGYSGARDHKSLADSGLIFCLNCKGEPRVDSKDHSFSPNGYILRRELISSIEVLTTELNRCFAGGDQIVLCSLFGRNWDPMDLSQLKKLLAICRKNISCLDIISDPMYSYGGFENVSRHVLEDDPDDLSNADPWKLRKDICLLFNFILARMKYFRKKFNSKQIDQLFGGLKNSLGKSQNWSSTLKTHCGYRNGNECTAAVYHTFHVNLELRWSLLIVYGVDNSTLNWVLGDLIYLAWFKYISNGDISCLQKKQPFNCWCVKEIWTMIRFLCEEIEKDFWTIFSDEMKRFINSSTQPDIFFPLWLVVHVATLSDYNLSGMYTPEMKNNTTLSSSRNGFSFVNYILKEWTTRGGKSAEVNLLVHRLLEYWGFELDVVVLFWNHWIPKIDQVGEASSLDNYSSVDKWLRLVKGLITLKTDPMDEIINGDPFLSFLRLLGANVRFAESKDWRKLKSHIGMKLNKNNVGNFNEIGLLRVSTLYLTLAFASNDTLSMCDRLKEILQYGKSTPGRKKTTLRAMATAILLLLQKSQDVSTVEIVTCFMDFVNGLMSQAPLDGLKKDCIMIYLDLLESLPSPSTPPFEGKSLGRETLISPNLTMWLSSCGPNYVVRTLRVLSKLTTWIILSKTGSLLTYSKERNDMSTKISERASQFLIQAVILNANRLPSTDVEPMANLAADLTFLSKGSDSFVRHFDHFALNERTCPDVSQFYISRLLMYGDSIENELSDIKWSQVWIRLNTLDCSIPEELNVKVMGVDFSSTSNAALLKRMCSNCDEWSRGDIQNILHPLVILTKAAVGSIFKDNPTVITSIVRNCSIVLKYMRFERVYIKGDSTSAGHKILETFIPPLIGTPPWEKLPQQVVSALKDNLFDIFEAIVTYTGSSSDIYLLRKVQDVVVFAFLGFVSNREELMNDDHPGTRIMMHAEENNIEIVLNQSILQLCKMSKDTKLTQRFVYSVTTLKDKGLTSTVMRFLAGILSIYVSATVNSEISNLCAQIAMYCCAFGQTPFKSSIIDAFEKSMDADFPFKSRRFFDLSTTLTKSLRQQVRKFLRIHLVPLYRKHVISCESRRGSGTDNSLRLPLEKLERETKGFDI